MTQTERKIVVLSDSHGNSANILKLISLHRDADCFIHLGDGAHEFSALCKRNSIVSYSLLGNCDLAFSCPEAESPYALYTIGGKRFFMTHGHRYGVKSTRDDLVAFAKEKSSDVDIILYGHTHVSENRYIPGENDDEKGIYLINPGSISLPRDSRYPSYALILIKGNDVLTNIAVLDR